VQIFAEGWAHAAENVWLSGEALQQALTRKVGITWSNIPVRRALESLSKTQNLAVMLDRRVDPDQKIELVFDDVPLAEALERIASRLHVGVTLLGPVAYFGPKQTAQRLRTVAALRNEEAEHLPSAMRSRWLQARPWKWDMLSAPRDLLAELGRENGLQIDGLHQIPADLWAAADLPPLALPDRLTLVLAQFDLTYEPSADGTSLRLVPMPGKPVIEQTYPVSSLPHDVATQLQQNKLLDGAEIDVAGNKLIVRGRQEDQDVVHDLLAGRTAHRTKVAEGRKVYTLRVELPVGKLLDALGPKMGVELQLDRSAITAAGISLETKVQVDVKEVSADELLRAVLEPAGLTYVRHENIVEVKPK
jgi:hypothetical protein